MCIIPMEKYQKAFATVSFADCHNISVAMWSLELWGVVMFESGPFPASFSVAEIWSLSKKRRSCKRERCASQQWEICSAVAFVKVQKGKVKD